MPEILKEILSHPTVIIVGICLLLMIVLFIVTPKKRKQNNNQRNSGAVDDEIGDKDKVESVSGYYRYQDDEQIVIKRTPEQQRIFEEYFVVKNYKTVTCDQSLKKKAKKINLISNFLLVPGIVLMPVGLIISDVRPLAFIGIAGVVISIILKILASKTMKKFEASIKVKVAPKKLMTDAEFEKLVDEKIESMDIVQLGLDKLGLDAWQVKAIHPIVFRDKVIKKNSFTVKNPDDHSVHSSTQYVTYLYFTDEQVYMYKIQFDMCCNAQEEWTSEIYYSDICDISSYTVRNVLKDGKFEFEYSTVSFNIITANSQLSFSLDGDNENIDSIQAMKKKIREKKSN